VGTLSKLLSAAARACVVSVDCVATDVEGVATAGGVPRDMIVAMPYRSRRLLAGLDSACGRAPWRVVAGGSTTLCGDADLRGLTVSSEPGAVLLAAAAAAVVDACRTSCISARSTDRTSTTPGEGGTRRSLRGDPVESVDDHIGRE